MNFRFFLLPSTDRTSQKMPVFRIRGMCHITIIVIRKVHQLHLKESLAGKPTSPSGRKLKPANYKPKIEKHIARIANAVRVTLWLSLAFFFVGKTEGQKTKLFKVPFWKLYLCNSWPKNGAVARDSFQLYNWYFIILDICNFDINYPLYFYGPLTLIMILWHLRAVTR